MKQTPKVTRVQCLCGITRRSNRDGFVRCHTCKLVVNVNVFNRDRRFNHVARTER